MQYDTFGKQGKQSSKVIIPSNDPKQAEVQLQIKGVVKRALTRKPLGGLVIRTLDPSPGQVGSVRLENQMDEPLQLKLKSSTLPELDVEIKEITPHAVYDVIARTNRVLKQSRTRGELVFSTGLSREADYTVHVSIQLKSKVEPSPRAMLLLKKDEPVERRISFHYYGADGPKNFRVTGAKCDHEAVHVTVGKTMPPANWMGRMTPPIKAHAEVKVRIDSPMKLPPEGVTIEFATNDPQYPKVDVLVTTDKAAFQQVMYGPSGRP